MFEAIKIYLKGEKKGIFFHTTLLYKQYIKCTGRKEKKIYEDETKTIPVIKAMI